MVHEREVVRREDHRRRSPGTFSAEIARVRKNVQRVQRRDDPDDLVDPVRVARARALVEAVEVLRRARVLVDLRLHRREVLGRLLLLRPCRTWTVSLPRAHPRHARAPRVASRRAARRARRRTSAARSARARAAARATWSSVQVPAPTPASSAAPSAVVSATSGTTTGHAEHVGLELHQPAVDGRAAVGAQLGERLAPARAPSPGRRRRSGRRSPRASARARCARVGAAREPDDRPARVGVPVRRAEAGQRGDEVDAVVGVQRRGERLGLGGASMIPRPSRSHCTAAPVTKIAASSA